MEFFIPGLCIFLVAIAISLFVAPKVTPLIAAGLSIIFLSFGVYQHYTMFASEYRLSTWQDGLKIYAPAIMIAALLIFIIYSIFAFFTKGTVPIPAMPSMPSMPSMNSIPSVTSVTNSVKETLSTAVNSLQNAKNSILPNASKNANKNASKNANKNANKNILKTLMNKNGKPSSSFVETI